MGRETRTALLLIAGGLTVALMSLFIQGMMLKSLPPGKRKQLGNRSASATIDPASSPAPAAPGAPPAAPAPPNASRSAMACAEKLGACLSANGKDATTAKTLGECYTLCVKASGPCDQHSCGDLCEAVYGLRDDCK